MKQFIIICAAAVVTTVLCCCSESDDPTQPRPAADTVSLPPKEGIVGESAD